MAPDYIELPLVADATALSDLAKDYLADNIEGWTARPGNVESILLEADGQVGAEIVDQVALVAPVVFAFYGEWLLGIALREATPAISSVAFTFDAGAVTIVPEGTLLATPNPDGNSYVFQTDAEVRSDAIDPSVSVTALEAGEAANGCEGASDNIDAIDGLAAVTMTAPATGGADEESAEDYLDRLADALTILAPRPILPQDFATMARQVPGVGRAIAIDLYQPGTSDNYAGPPALTVEGTPVNTGAGITPVERCVTVAILAEEGTIPTQALMHATWVTLDAAREVNFLVYVIPPKPTTIDVRATVVRLPGYLDADVQEAAEEMMAAWLDPQAWGSATVGEEEGWIRETVARLYEAVDYLNRAGGVSYVASVELRKAGGTYAAADVALTGVAPFPLAGEILITVNPPA